MATNHPKFGAWHSTTQFPGICTIKVFLRGVVVKKNKENPLEYPTDNLEAAKKMASDLRMRVFNEGKDVNFIKW